MKKCTKCGIEKDFKFFYKKGNGYYPSCKDCEIERSKKYINENKEIVSDRRKKRYYENHETNLEKKREYDNQNREIVREKARNSYDRKKASRYYLENKSKIRAKNKQWISENKDYFKDLNSKNTTRWSKNNPHIIAWRSVLHRVIKQFGMKKESRTMDILGYSATDFKNHISSLFEDGMSWENWGTWHIDHIYPVSKFDKNTPVSEVNALSNLQPLWAKDNLEKHNS
jgi:hypothetical protein